MNTKSLLTRIAVPVLSLGMLGGLGATLATSASAATLPGTVTANTHLNNHPDTTSASGSATIDSPGGPIWAYDNATEKFSAVQQQDGSWLVTMGYVGSFHGFANPRTADEMAAAMPVLTSPAPGAALDSAGSVKGTISYTVTSNGTPDPSRLPGQVPSDTHISANIKTLFGDQNATVTPVTGSYTFTYHQIEGQDYTQVG